MSLYRTANWPVLLFLLAAISFLAGCGAPPARMAPVRGTVLHNGQPLAFATVRFHQVGARETSGTAVDGITAQNGTFELKTYGRGSGAPVGSYKVTVTPIARPDHFSTDYLSPETTHLQVDVKEGGTDALVLDVRSTKD